MNDVDGNDEIWLAQMRPSVHVSKPPKKPLRKNKKMGMLKQRDLHDATTPVTAEIHNKKNRPPRQ